MEITIPTFEPIGFFESSMAVTMLAAAIIIAIVAAIRLIFIVPKKPVKGKQNSFYEKWDRQEFHFNIVMSALLVVVALGMSMMAWDSDSRSAMNAQHEATLTKLFEEVGVTHLDAQKLRNEPCSEGSPYEVNSYSWRQDGEQGLTIGLMEKSAAKDGYCIYTLHPERTTL